jgi:hypothetical protein
MYLDVEFTDGTITHIPVSATHTIRVISPDDHVQDSFSFGGVKNVSLNPDGAPAATDPNPQVAAGAAEGATVTETVDAQGAPVVAETVEPAAADPAGETADIDADSGSDTAGAA